MIVVVAGILVSILENKSRVCYGRIARQLGENKFSPLTLLQAYNFSLPLVFSRIYSHYISIRRLSVTNVFHCQRKQLTYHEVMDAVFSRHKICS